MDERKRLKESIENLLPLDEDDVEEFEGLVGELAAFSDESAARLLLGLLDDSLELGGVNQNVAGQLGAFPADVLVGEFVSALPAVLKKAPRASRDIVRGILASEERRALLIARIGQLDAGVAAAFRPVVERVAKYARYRDAGKELLEVLASSLTS